MGLIAGGLIAGERVLWRGRPGWRAVMRDVLHVRIILGYFAVILLWGFANDRADGWGKLDTLWRGTPVVAMALALFGACALFAWAICRTTSYELTSERCVLHYGVALTASLSIPLRRIATVGVHARGDGTGDVLLTPKPGARLRYVKLWPHARPWRWSRAEPMLRGVPDATGLGRAISEAAAAVAPGVVHAEAGQEFYCTGHPTRLFCASVLMAQRPLRSDARKPTPGGAKRAPLARCSEFLPSLAAPGDLVRPGGGVPEPTWPAAAE